MAPVNPTLNWQNLPWNALFWVSTAVLVLVAGGLTVEVELRRRATHAVDVTADIHDGDLVDVLVVVNGDEVIVSKAGARARVRMLGINAYDPVVNEFEITAYGRAAVAFLENWVLGHEVKLVFDRTVRDVHGRYLAYLERDGTDVNRHMLEEGVAMAYTEYPFVREASYLSAEVIARSARRGIWAGIKSSKRTKALRHDWAAARRQRGDKTFADPLRE